MSIHIEYMHAPLVSVSIVNELDIHGAEDPSDQQVLVIETSDSATVFTGTREDFFAIAHGIVDAIEAADDANAWFARRDEEEQ